MARSRRRRSGALGATALALLATLIVVPLVAQPKRSGSAEPPLPSPGPSLPGKPGDFTLTGPESGVDVRVDGCVLRFARTTDGGRTWSDWDDARYQATRCEPGPAASRANLEYSVLGDRTYLVYDGGLRRLSTDYGRTWQDAHEAITAVRAFPPTARPVFCQFPCQAVDQPLAVDPSTGGVYRLSGPPPSLLPFFSLYPASDGSIWITYGVNQAEVGARSTDRGVTWTTWTPPTGKSLLALVAVDERKGYQLVSGADGAVTLERTQDGGRSWSTTLTGLPEVAHWDLTVGSDGSLLAITQTGPDDARAQEVLVSRDDGRSFTVARGDGMPVASVCVVPGYAWLFGGGGGPEPEAEADHLVLTQDGRIWKQFLLAAP
ncbi:hypothetical protein FXF50_17225 [Micromonospora sp. AP08]|uniref:hypothetical protein n=1 Tax=Micromonospora sp. AP08 TaxID=2604467 RepID=UPI0011D5E57D|nr:hypothetical protein [Micromonospora sp. AP08]TYB36776.1 hypothetical protein FXF50_17225 [Micromonospora sp. AP08]